MKTILFNTQTNKVAGKIREGSFNGIWNSSLSKQPGWLPEHIIELEVIDNDTPLYDAETERISFEWTVNTEEKTYYKLWTVTNIPQEEIDYNNALKDWPKVSWAKRIIAPVDLAMQDVGAKMYVWFSLMGFPIVRVDDQTVHLYCNTILPEHQSIVDGLGEMVNIEDRPEILNP